MDSEHIEQKSKIYDTARIDPSHKMWQYFYEMNKAAYKLAVDSSELLSDKGKLTSMARKLIHNDGYVYKKKTSRSKQLNEGKEKKREYLSDALKEKRLKEIEEDLTDTNTQMALLTRQREKHVNVKQFGQAANITDQLSQLRGKKRKLDEELTMIQSKKKLCQRQKAKTIQKSSTKTSEHTSIASCMVSWEASSNQGRCSNMSNANQQEGHQQHASDKGNMQQSPNDQQEQFQQHASDKGNMEQSPKNQQGEFQQHASDKGNMQQSPNNQQEQFQQHASDKGNMEQSPKNQQGEFQQHASDKGNMQQSPNNQQEQFQQHASDKENMEQSPKSQQGEFQQLPIKTPQMLLVIF